MKHFLLFCFILLTLSGCAPDCDDPQNRDLCTRVLFIGNSYTYVNDLPAMLTSLAQSGGHKVKTGMVAEGGWTLEDHVNSAQTLDTVGSVTWDFVVLQEQSQIPSVAEIRSQKMYPAARQLVHKINQAGATPIFFLTWAHRQGWPENGMNDYASMQGQTNQGYWEIAQELAAPIAPVGYAWSAALEQNPQWELWQADGSHPAEPGTYLAACVFYAVIFQESPAGLTYQANLSQELATALQAIAAQVVLDDPKQWNLPGN